MNLAARGLALAASIAFLIPICAFGPGSEREASTNAMADVIVTAAAAYEPLAALHGGKRFPKGAQLLLVHEGKGEPLVGGFAASADANVSFDAKRVLFAGKQAANGSWQIWELTLADHSRAQADCRRGRCDTAFLPACREAGVRATHFRMGFNLKRRELTRHGPFAPIDPQRRVRVPCAELLAR